MRHVDHRRTLLSPIVLTAVERRVHVAWWPISERIANRPLLRANRQLL